MVLPGTQRVPDYPRVRVYRAPELGEEPAIEASEIKTVQVVREGEALVLLRPGSSPLLGAVIEGARLPVLGRVRGRAGCAAQPWYALAPAGYVCSTAVRPTAQPPTTEPVLVVPSGERLPFHYVMVGKKEGEKLPFWATLEEAREGAQPERQLERGDTVAVSVGRPIRIEGEPHYVSVEGKVFPIAGTYPLQGGSDWRGETLDETTHFPWGWTTPELTKVYGEPKRGRSIDELPRRTQIAILEEAGQRAQRMLRIAEGRWLRAADVNEVRRMARPEGITAAVQWIDVDLGEQTLVAYEGERPVFATLVSSGRAIPTPRGNYPIWAKVSSISMKSQPYEDKAYFVNKVPWVLFFQAHNAIHGAYWHDRFGITKSHGCINVSPLDARHLFEWVAPPLPAAWSGYRFPDLLASPTVHVRNSHLARELLQERPIGPPDRELEAQKLLEAEARRANPPVP